MKVPFLNVPAQYHDVQETVDASVREVLASGMYVLGKYNRQLESELALMHGVRHGVAVNSGTDALRILLQAAGVGPGDEVITTAFTFVATVEVILQVGATPVFVDIDEETFMMDPERLEATLTERTKAIMPVHLYGQLAPMEPMVEFARRHGLAIVEDSAQAVDCSQDGVHTGQFGVGAGLSFYVTKNLGAAGDGGLILTDDDRIAEISRSLRVHGMGRERYFYDDVGYTSRMAEIQAAVLCAKLPLLKGWNHRRAELALIYQEELAGTQLALPKTLDGNVHTWQQFTVITDKRDDLARHLADHGVGSAVYYPVPLHLHRPYHHLSGGVGSLPVTESVAQRCLSLPVHPHLSDEQVRFAAHTVRDFVG